MPRYSNTQDPWHASMAWSSFHKDSADWHGLPALAESGNDLSPEGGSRGHGHSNTERSLARRILFSAVDSVSTRHQKTGSRIDLDIAIENRVIGKEISHASRGCSKVILAVNHPSTLVPPACSLLSPGKSSLSSYLLTYLLACLLTYLLAYLLGVV